MPSFSWWDLEDGRQQDSDSQPELHQCQCGQHPLSVASLALLPQGQAWFSSGQALLHGWKQGLVLQSASVTQILSIFLCTPRTFNLDWYIVPSAGKLYIFRENTTWDSDYLALFPLFYPSFLLTILSVWDPGTDLCHILIKGWAKVMKEHTLFETDTGGGLGDRPQVTQHYLWLAPQLQDTNLGL